MVKSALWCLVSVVLFLSQTIPVKAADPKRPNILFILVDDPSPFDLKVYDPKSPLDSPVINGLAAQGMTLDRAYHMGSFSGAVCTPSRHMIMCGRSVWHLPIGPGARALCPPELEKNTTAAVFNRAGYDTMRTCKQGNSYEAANKQFTVRHDATKRGGSAESGSDWHTEEVLLYLNDREKRKDADPFLIHFGFSHPHDTRDGTPELLKKYGAVNHTDRNTLPLANPRQPKLPPNYLPRHPFDNTDMDVRDEKKVSGVWEKRDEATIRNELGREMACAENIDIQIGRVLDKLKAMGELENTYIIYTADHGMAIGRHGLQGKQNLYEHTWRVPFIVKGPGIKPGSRAPGNIYLADILATLCDFAGITPPQSNEGLSIRPVLEGKKETIRDVLYGAYAGGGKPGMRCVRQGNWKLLKYETADGKSRVTQLFNLKDNPHELMIEHHNEKVIALTGITPTAEQVNLAEHPQHAEKRKELEALLFAEMRRLHDPYRFWDQPKDDTGIVPPAKGKNKPKQEPGT
ncbi:sulfatase-like hydrolase/transferase [soil metagenome]